MGRIEVDPGELRTLLSVEATYGTLPGGSWIDPDAPRPPVGFRVRLPGSWEAIDLDPATSHGWVRSHVRERVDAAPELAHHQRRMRRVLGEFLDDCRAQGLFLLRLLPAAVVDQPEDLVGASLALAWRRLAGNGRVDVDGLARSIASTPAAPGEPVTDRVVSVVELPTGPAVRLHTSQLAAAPGRPGQRRRTVLSQFLVPVPGLPWVGVVTAASADRELADGTDAIADGVASSLEFLPPSGPRGAGTTAEGAGTPRVG
jgi:hypothetical protein